MLSTAQCDDSAALGGSYAREDPGSDPLSPSERESSTFGLAGVECQSMGNDGQPSEGQLANSVRPAARNDVSTTLRRGAPKEN